MRVPVRVAEVIGIKAPDIQAKTFQVDFSVANADVALKGFITPGYYKSEPWKIHTDDICRYYKEPLAIAYDYIDPTKFAFLWETGRQIRIPGGRI